MKFIPFFIFFIFFGCSVTQSFDEKWLSSIAETTWDHLSEILVFDNSGKTASKGIYTYTYDYSPNHQSGVYFTQFTLAPIQWYLLEKSESKLIQYGPFFSKNDISKNNSQVLIFTLNF